MLTREQFLAAAGDSFKPTPLDVPELGGTVHVRALDAVELSRARTLSAGDGATWPAWLALHGVCDADGRALLTPADFGGFIRAGFAVHRIANEVSRLTKLDESEQAAGNG